jgi:hypothetical protein
LELPNAVQHLLPTPVVNDMGEGKSPLLPTPRTSDTNGPGLHGDGGMDLRTAVTLLPTPRTTDTKATGYPSPAVVRRAATGEANLGEKIATLFPRLRGAHTSPPSSDGKPCSDDPPPPPPTTPAA